MRITVNYVENLQILQKFEYKKIAQTRVKRFFLVDLRELLVKESLELKVVYLTIVIEVEQGHNLPNHRMVGWVQ